MITLYHSRGARSFRALWTLEELGLPYDLHLLPFPPRQTTPSYLDINPAGTVPLLIDGDTRMTESVAICHYLATRGAGSTLAVAADEPGYAAYLDFLVMGEASITIPVTAYHHAAKAEPARAEAAAEKFAAILQTAVPRAGDTFVAAGRFTVADISVGFALQLATAIGLGPRLPPWFTAHFERMRARPGYRRARDAERRS